MTILVGAESLPYSTVIESASKHRTGAIWMTG